MLPKLAQFLTDRIDEITRRWVESLRRATRTEVHKTMLTAEIVSSAKGLLASLASAIASYSVGSQNETLPIALVDPPAEEGSQAPPRSASEAQRRRGTQPLLVGGPFQHALETATALGQLRHKQGYQLHEILLEYALLRQAIWDLLRADAPGAGIPPTYDLPRYLDRLFDELVLHSVEAYYEAAVRDLEKRAIRDPLTQLYNKEYFAQRLHEEVRRALRYNQSLTLAMIDMDRLKHVNDTYGHQVGDAMIKAVTNAICDTCRQVDIPCRYGGDEFVVILPETNKSQAAVFAERALRVVRGLTVVTPQGRDALSPHEEPGAWEQAIVPVPTISIGLASFPEDGRNPETLIANADAALYRAKRKGRNVVSG